MKTRFSLSPPTESLGTRQQHAKLVAAEPLRRGKLNSQFIVTRFSILHAGGRSLFRFHISPTATFSMSARDKKTHKTVFTSLQGPEEVIKELLESTVARNYATIVAGDLDRYQRSAIWSHRPWTTPSIARTIVGDFEI